MLSIAAFSEDLHSSLNWDYTSRYRINIPHFQSNMAYLNSMCSLLHHPNVWKVVYCISDRAILPPLLPQAKGRRALAPPAPLSGVLIYCTYKPSRLLYLHSALKATAKRLILLLFDCTNFLNFSFCFLYDSTTAFIPFVTVSAVSSLRANCLHGLALSRA